MDMNGHLSEIKDPDYHFFIDAIVFQNGPTLTPGHLVVLVGPNNSGKSLALREIASILRPGGPEPTSKVKKIVGSAHCRLPEGLAVMQKAYPWFLSRDDEGAIQPVRVYDGTRSGHLLIRFGPDADEQVLAMAQKDAQGVFLGQFGRGLVELVGTDTRLTSLTDAPYIGLNDSPHDLTQALRQRPGAVNALNKALTVAFRLAAVIDHVTASYLQVRIGHPTEIQEVENQETSTAQMSLLHPLADQGDGIRAFVSVSAALLVEERPVLLVDEPEAFLHPLQATQMGELIGELATRQRQTIVATHSANLLSGLASRCSQITLIRLTRTSVDAPSRVDVLDGDDVERLVRDPVLGSARVLDGLFSEATIVVEADADRAFYQRVARTLFPEDDVHFVHAHGKGGIPKILRRYRRMGISSAAIVDFDILKQWGELSALLSARDDQADHGSQESWWRVISNDIQSSPSSESLARIGTELCRLATDWPRIEDEAQALSALQRISRQLERLTTDCDPWRSAKVSGCRAFRTNEGRQAFRRLDEFCRECGIFIVSVGELESWLTPYGIQRLRDKGAWIESALTWLQTHPPDNNPHGPWVFMRSLRQYLYPRMSPTGQHAE